MKFIIPQNYKFKNKIFGIIDYPTAIFNIIWNFIIYIILKNIHMSISIRICIFSSLSFPVFLITMIGFNNESPVYAVRYIFNYLFRPKVYLFEKDLVIKS